MCNGCILSLATPTRLVTALHEEAYADNRYKKEPEGGHKRFPLETLSLLGLLATVARDVPITAKLTAVIASGVTLARDLVGEP